MNLASINVKFGADTSGFTSGIRSMQSLMSGFSGSAAGIFAGVGVAIAGLAVVMGVEAVKAAGNFQQGLNRLVTGAGDTTDNMHKMGQAILGISQDTGVLTGQLLPAMYQIISAGQRGAQAQDTLRVAAEGAVVEQAKIVDVAKAITTAMTDYVKMHLTATQAMNGYTRAVQLGKLTLEELATAMSPVLPIAAALGVSFADIAAAMSTMTNAGVPANRAATSLQFLMKALEVPTAKSAKAMKEWGLSTVAVGDEMKKSLPGALEMIYKAALKAGPEGSVPFNRAMIDMIGGQHSLLAALSLTGSHFQTYEDNVKKIADAMGISKTAVLGWDVAQQNFNVQLSKANAVFQGLLITVGSLLLPVLGNLLSQVTPIIQSFTDWFNTGDNLKNGLQTLSDIMAPLVSAIQDMAAFLAPIIAQVMDWAVQNDVAGKALAVLKIYVQLLAAEIRFMVPIIVQVITAIVQFAAAIWERIGPAVLTIVAFIRTHWSEIVTIFQGVWDQVVGVLEIAWSLLKGIILVGLDVLTGHWSQAWTDMKDAAAGIWDGLKKAALGFVKSILGFFSLIPGGIGQMAKDAQKQLDKMTGVVDKATTEWQKAANLHALQMSQDVVDDLKKMRAGVEKQMKNAHDAVTKHALQMKLDAIDAAIKTNEETVKQFQAMVDGVNSKSKTMADDAIKHATFMQQQVVQQMRDMKDQAVGHSIVPDMVKDITTAFINMASAATSWATTMVNNFLSGLKSAWGAVTSWLSTALANLAGMFPASPVKHGPLKGSEMWGYNFARNIADGLRAGTGEVQAAMAGMLGGTMGSMSMSHNFSGSFGGGSPAFFGGGGSPVIVNHNVFHCDGHPVYLDGHLVTKQIGQELAYELNAQNGTRRSGR